MQAFQEMNNDLGLRLPSEVFNQPEPIAFIGICARHSPSLTRMAHISAQRLNHRCPPFTHKSYGFQSLAGQVLTREEMYIPKYCVSVPAALLSLLLEERIPSVENLIATVENEFVRAKKTLTYLQSNHANTQQLLNNVKNASNKVSSRALTQLSEMKRERSSSAILMSLNSSGGGGGGEETKEQLLETHQTNQANIMVEIETAEIKVDTLKRGHEVLKEVEKSLHSDYMDCLNHCLSVISDEKELELQRKSPNKNTKTGGGKDKKQQQKYIGGISMSMGGARLKRSVMKKSTLHAFIPTNLNVQLLHTESVRSHTNEKQNTDVENTNTNTSSPFPPPPPPPPPPNTNTPSPATTTEDTASTQVNDYIMNVHVLVESNPSDEQYSLFTGVCDELRVRANESLALLKKPQKDFAIKKMKEAEKIHDASISKHTRKSDSQTQKIENFNADDDLDTLASLTFGVPSAHSLDFPNGGLRRLLLSQASDGVFRSNELLTDQTKTDYDLSISRAAQACALHARGLEITVADMRSHASGRRRNSVLRVASSNRSNFSKSPTPNGNSNNTSLGRSESVEEGGGGSDDDDSVAALAALAASTTYLPKSTSPILRKSPGQKKFR